MSRLILILLFSLMFTGCNNSYSLEDGKKNGDIIMGPPGEINLDKIDGFVNDVKNQTESRIRIASYSVEGDPILNDLYYNGNTIQYTYDNSRDKHGGKRKGKYKTECRSIEVREVVEENALARDEYFLTECDEIIGVHDLEKKQIYIMTKNKEVGS